ncbi:MAG: dehydratase [Anaerolineae bacterium]|nr:dehydratase [Anaerolineae bacterium]
MADRRGRGLYFEEFQVGDDMISPGRTVTETDIVQFSGLTGDWTQLHSDAVWAAETPFGQRIAHGALGLSMATGLLARMGVIEGTALAFRGIDEWKFSKPIFIGDTIHVAARVVETKAVPRLGGGQVILAVSVVNQKGDVCQRGLWNVLIQAEEGPG